MVRPGDVVADIGAGSGVLSHLALRAGASKVYAVELLPKTFQFLRRTLRTNGIEDRVIAVQADGEKWVPPERVDVVLCELMETGLLHEPIASVMRHVQRWPHRPRAILPQGANLSVRLVDAFTEYHAYRVQNAGFQPRCRRLLSKAICYASYDFLDNPPGTGVDTSVEIPVEVAGTASAIRLETTALVSPANRARPSARHCTPLVLTLDEPLRVRRGERLTVKLRYSFSFDDAPIEFQCIP